MTFRIDKAIGKSAWLLTLLVALSLQACGGGGSSSGASRLSPDDGNGSGSDQQVVDEGDDDTVSFVKRAGISTYAGSTVQIDYYDATNGWQPQASMTTSDSGALADLGVFDLAEVNFLDDTWYRFTVSGGVSLDEDMDGAIDSETPTVNGRLRSLAKGQWLRQQGGSHISAATEFAYTSLHKLLVADEIDWTAVEAGLEAAADKLLFVDQTGDGEISAEDLLAQDPQALQESLHFYQRNQLEQLNEVVDGGLSSQLTGTRNGMLLPDSEHTYNEIVVSSDRLHAYAALGRDGVLLYDVRAAAETIIDTNISTARKLALSENRGLLFVAGGSGGVEVIDLATETLVTPLLSSYGYVQDVAVSPDEGTLYVATSVGLLVYDLDAASYSEFLTGNCADLTLASDGSRLAMGCFDGLRVYDVAAGEISHDIELASTAYTVLLDGDSAYVANEGDGLTVVDLATGSYTSYATPNGEWLKAIAVSDDADRLAVFPLEGSYSFDLVSRTYTGELFPEIKNDSTEYVSYLPENNAYVFDYYGYVAEVLETADFLSVIDDSNHIFNTALGASGEQVFYSDYYGMFAAYSPASGAIESYDLPGNVSGFAVNAAESQAYVIWRDNGYFVLDLTDGSYVSVDLGKSLADLVLDEEASRLYVVDYKAYQVLVYSTVDNSLVGNLDLGTCQPIFLRLSKVENALDVSCAKSGIKRMDLTSGDWELIMEGTYLYSFDYNDDESLMYIRKDTDLLVRDMATATDIQTISYTGGDSGMTVFGTEYWEEMNAVILGGNQGARLVSLDTEKQYWLHTEFGNSFAIDRANQQLYLAAANDAGLLMLDMRDFQ